MEKIQTKNPKYLIVKYLGFLKVRLKGLEPSRRKTLDPKSSASANSATSAVFTNAGAKLLIIPLSCKFFPIFLLSEIILPFTFCHIKCF